ncbi:MFS transporter, putative [Talaromyces stipitatus ATCC 10500]|uniref:MFS transporter, putative n=1 Tax=Talaromyces stipitatus (strain ATCC 10500 / CBS 375.48 / QM 6759 / NRRL 1006) TaxID=441959 RepID=B8MNZ4_TALSN|nr:MFS transporter, putative [Talaromyces stipitatus ATCC 10500]EED14233.1 MFS transporter, putative [Talaromyces stipitatus ATCC 10500]
MSLIQHVSSIEGVDREPAADAVISPRKAVHRVLSYDAFPRRNEDDSQSSVAAYKVFVTKRIAQVIATILACWVASGIVFGFAALKPVLLSEGVYEWLCDKDELENGVEVCFKQELQLNLFFTIASITANVSALPIGTMLDRFGPRFCNLAGCLFLAVGSLLMYLAFRIPEFDGYLIGNFFLSLGGTCIFVPAFQIANAFPKHSGVIVALVTGAFDASAAVFLFYRLAYEASDRGLRPEYFFLGYLSVPLAIFLTQIFLLPAKPYKTASQLEEKIEAARDSSRDIHDSDDEISDANEVASLRAARRKKRQAKLRNIDNVLGGLDERQHREEQEEERHAAARVWGVLHGEPIQRQFMSPWFILITLLTVLQMLRMNYFIGTIRAQYEYMLNSEALAQQINNLFDAALPVGGVITTPFIGFLLDHLSVPNTLTLIVFLTTAVGVLNCLPYLWAGYVTVILFVLLRPLYYSAMSDYATKVFGFSTFGRIYGAIICISGIISFAQTGLDALTQGTLKGNPTPINIALAVLTFIIGTILVVFVKVESRRWLAEGAESERQGLLEGVEEESEEEY